MLETVPISVFNILSPTAHSSLFLSAFAGASIAVDTIEGEREYTLATSTSTSVTAFSLAPLEATKTDIEETMETTQSYIESLSAEELEDLRGYLSTYMPNNESITYGEIEDIDSSLDDLSLKQLKEVKTYIEENDEESIKKGKAKTNSFW